VIFKPVTVGMRRRSWRWARRGRPPCREPGPHNIRVLIYEQPQHISKVTASMARPAVRVMSGRRVDSRRSWWNYCVCKHLAR